MQNFMAKRSARAMHRLLRYSAYAGGGAVGVLASQAWYVKVNFKLPPDATGPTAGVVGAGPGKPTQRRNIVFMGDSVVTGVGCRAEVGEGPVMPRATAEVIARNIGEQVAWSALGYTGADVPVLLKDYIPTLRREVQQCAQTGGRVDAVVVLCGLNDVKSCFLYANPRRHPGAFRQSLHELVHAIHEVVGHECVILLPAMPIDASPRFNRFWPLRTLVHKSAAAWEQQKQAVAEACHAAAANAPDGPRQPHVCFLEQPPHTPLEYFSEDVRCLRLRSACPRSMLLSCARLARQGMHPNDVGYAAWGGYIANRLLLDAFPESKGSSRAR